MYNLNQLLHRILELQLLEILFQSASHNRSDLHFTPKKEKIEHKLPNTFGPGVDVLPQIGSQLPHLFLIILHICV